MDHTSTTDYSLWEPVTLNKLVRDLLAEVATLKDEKRVLLTEVRRLYLENSKSGEA